MAGSSISKVIFALLGGVLLLVSESAALSCKGTIYFQPPSSWTSVYIAGCGQFYAPTKGTSGWYEIDPSIATSAGLCSDDFKFTNSNAWNGDWFSMETTNGGQNSGTSFNCSTIGTDDIYIQEDPNEAGKSWYSSDPPNAKYLYVLIPEDKDWMISNPMLSIDGTTENGIKLVPDATRCGWYYYVFFNVDPGENAFIYRDDDTEDQIGINGLWGDAFEPINLNAKFAELETDQLFFIPDDAAWPDDGSTNGWYTLDNGVEGVCTYSIAALIYDTDASVNDLFSEYQGLHGTYTETCVGVHQGIVKDVLGADNKPQLNVGSSNAAACFGNDESLFNTLFNYTPGKNEVSCYDLPFTRETDGRWGYNSDNAVTGTTVGGFYPVEDKTDASIITVNGVLQGPLAAARTTRAAEGPVDIASLPTGITNIDYVCNGPGWSGGIDCEGLFVSDDETGVKWQWDKSPSGGARWGSQKRNQHFCFESHATFTYDPAQEFTFRGDDDIWVFIAGKLAVDNGGTHLAAPGHVVLKDITDKDGNALVAGQTYKLDIFFCDRRTTMSNVIIKTNMYIKQSTGLDYSATKDESTGITSYEICYEESGDGSCAAALSGQDGVQSYCGDEIVTLKGLDIEYYITTRAGTMVDTLPAAKVFYSGIDLTTRSSPKVNLNNITGLNPGSYRLVVAVNGKKTYINFRIKGNLDVVNETSGYNPISGDETSTYYPAGTKWTFVDKALAGTRVPIYVSAVSEGEVDLLSAPGQSYSLTLSAGAVLYTDSIGDTQVEFPRTIDETGIDTVWLTLPLAGLEQSPTTVSVAYKAIANVSFYAPELKFVRNVEKDSLDEITSFDIVTGDPDTDENGEAYFNWMGTDVELQLVAWNPITASICKECNFSVNLVDGSSRVGAVIGSMENGLASVTVTSEKVYYPDTSAYITLAATENLLVNATYNNMFFREPPCPYPNLVELYDVRGDVVKNSMRIPSPFHSESKEYLDGIGDSIVVVYHRPFGKDASGTVPNDSLPNFICINWDEDKYFNLTEFSFDNSRPRGTTNVKYLTKDSLVTCSDTIGRAEILSAFKTRPNDSTLVFSGEYSKNVKTADDGSGTGLSKVQLRSWATYEDRGKVTVSSFDKKISDKMAPVIVSARLTVDATNEDFDNVKFTFSEPLKAVSDDANLRKAFSYYVYSAGIIDAAKYPYDESRYLTPDALQNVTLGSDSATVRYRHKSGTTVNPTPQNGDYVRFAFGVVSDTSGNAPTDYSVSIASPWVEITGTERLETVKIPYSELNTNDPLVQDAIKNKTVLRVVGIDKFESDKASVSALYPNTVGTVIKPSLAYYFTNDSVDVKNVVMKYEIYNFTNLGTFVASDKGTISCDDESIYGKGETCQTSQKYVYLGWTGVTNDGRLAGSGAYISKMTAKFVVEGTYKEGIKKKAGQNFNKAFKIETTNTYGFRRITK